MLALVSFWYFGDSEDGATRNMKCTLSFKDLLTSYYPMHLHNPDIARTLSPLIIAFLGNSEDTVVERWADRADVDYIVDYYFRLFSFRFP